MASPHAESFYCISEENLSLDDRKIYTGTCIGCAAIGLAGSLTQVISLRNLWKSTPVPSNRNPIAPNAGVVFFLALADMLACFAVITRSVTLAVISPPTSTKEGLAPASPVVVNIGAPIQSFLQFFFLATYFWTFFFALDVYLQLSKRSVSNMSYHLFTWVAAAILTGFSEFIVFYDVGFPCADRTRVTLAHMATYIPIVFVMVANPVIYVMSYMKYKKLLRGQGYFGHSQYRRMRQVTHNFSKYVIFFWICWIPSIATGIYLQVKGVDVKFPFSLWMLTAILNPLQGFFNCFIYGIGSDMVTKMEIAERQVKNSMRNVRRSSSSTGASRTQARSYSSPGPLTAGTFSKSNSSSSSSRNSISTMPRPQSQGSPDLVFQTRIDERSPLLENGSASRPGHSASRESLLSTTGEQGQEYSTISSSH
ncbi:G-protein coupled receptor 143-like [Sycon ciliatum]|uniref:G-protein coupled receptor 143-like n=1 Tax=Sycon ciliatum TaxID=27933 RepID=UPI0020AB9DCB|eukprot:scpid48137/ scgid23679/ G-protein coupled receptor 143; Ocular albinism type 1 protein